MAGCSLESEPRTAVAGYGRVGLVGGIGCGKSGVSRYALGAPGLGMIALNVATEDREKIATVRGGHEPVDQTGRSVQLGDVRRKPLAIPAALRVLCAGIGWLHRVRQFTAVDRLGSVKRRVLPRCVSVLVS